MVMDSRNNEKKIAIVGAGIAGLECAKILINNGFNVTVFDKESEVGGRMRTSEIDGFLLDHGFHVLQTAYPETSKQIDYKSLDCKPLCSKYCWSRKATNDGFCDIDCNQGVCEYDGGDCI